MRRTALLFFAIPFLAAAQYQDNSQKWVEPAEKDTLPAFDVFNNFLGKLGVIQASGPVDTSDHPFFTPLGTNGRACVTCHQPTYGMSISAEGLRNRWQVTGGKDPVFAAFDGSNCPDLPQDQEKSHSLLLDRGLFRIPLPWPPKSADGSPKPVEFSIEVVRDPTGCNLSPAYGLKSPNPTISVYRRPRPAANLKYVISGAQNIVLKTGMLADRDPETDKPVSMNLMADAREPSLATQALDAILGHEEAREAPSGKKLKAIVDYESQVYMAQVEHVFAGPLVEPDGPFGLGPAALRDRRAGVLGDNESDPVFGLFTSWKGKDFYRASIARGADIFMNRQFWIRDAAHINSIGLGNPIKRTCATCHNAQMTGQDLSAGWVDVGTTNYPTWTEPDTWQQTAELPVFKITCRPDADPHPYLGRVIYTTDPGRALISGRCVDVGSIVMQQLRGLAARAP